jgi:membrane protease YdiL (CAAX protease family)
MHLSETRGFRAALLGIAAMALIALWFRLRCAAIGPAIAAHFGYNTVFALTILFR